MKLILFLTILLQFVIEHCAKSSMSSNQWLWSPVLALLQLRIAAAVSIIASTCFYYAPMQSVGYSSH